MTPGRPLRLFWVRKSFGIGTVRDRTCPLFRDSLHGHTVPRTREGYYHYTGGIKAAIKRSLTFAPYADLIWLETKSPDLEQARAFAREIRKRFPGKWLVYNLSPSFNWAGHGFSGGHS
jgi:isocitrate lyase